MNFPTENPVRSKEVNLLRNYSEINIHTIVADDSLSTYCIELFKIEIPRNILSTRRKYTLQHSYKYG